MCLHVYIVNKTLSLSSSLGSEGLTWQVVNMSEEEEGVYVCDVTSRKKGTVIWTDYWDQYYRYDQRLAIFVNKGIRSQSMVGQKRKQ